MIKAHTLAEMSKRQHKNATETFDYTAIVDRLTVGAWSVLIFKVISQAYNQWIGKYGNCLLNEVAKKRKVYFLVHTSLHIYDQRAKNEKKLLKKDVSCMT